MATLQENIKQAIADFDDIEKAIKEQGVDVPSGTDTSEYGNLIRGSGIQNLETLETKLSAYFELEE